MRYVKLLQYYEDIHYYETIRKDENEKMYFIKNNVRHDCVSGIKKKGFFESNFAKH